MEKISLMDTIYEISRIHLNEHNGILLGECVSDPGGVSGTIPESKNVIDLPMTEISGADFAVGCALTGRRPIFVVRFQDFMLMNGSPFIAFAAAYKYVNGISAPVFIRALANDHFDATHSNVLHSMFMHYPGFKVCAPITPGEYREAWSTFMQNDMPMYVSEYRDTFDNTEEYEDEIDPKADINVFAVSVCRMNALKAKELLLQEGIKINVLHIMWLKPFDSDKYVDMLKKVPLGLVVDPGHEICGAPEAIAYELMLKAPGSHVEMLGIADTFKTTNPNYYNSVPSGADIADRVEEMLRKKCSAFKGANT